MFFFMRKETKEDFIAFVKGKWKLLGKLVIFFVVCKLKVSSFREKLLNGCRSIEGK